MAKQPSTTLAKPSQQAGGEEPSKRELQRQIGRTRESVAETVGEIKETAGDIKQTAKQELDSAKQAVSGVLDYRDQFQKEPIVWSLGALSAGFALGYTLGYAHKITRRDKNSPVAGFVDGVVDELSRVGQRVVMPNLNVKIRELFGFDFPALLGEMRGGTGRRKRATGKAGARKTSAKKSSRKKKAR
jgi:hypothetical protein